MLSQSRPVVRRSIRFLGMAWAASSALALPAEAIPHGGQFQVNTYTTNAQTVPSVGVAPDGDFVVVWQSTGSSGGDTNLNSIQGQRYASSGTPQGAQFQVNTYTTNQQQSPSVAVAGDETFVVVWQSTGSSGGDTSTQSIQGQRYASSGAAQGAQFQVNTVTLGAQTIPAVTAAADGDFVVVWQSATSAGGDTSGASIQARRFASNGSAQGADFQVNTYTTTGQLEPAAALAADEDFVVVWRSSGSSGTDADYSIQGQRYASDGSSQGGEFQVNTYTTDFQINPSVASAADGDFVVVWQSPGSYGTDSDYQSIQGQRYASDGSAQGAEFQVNTYTTQDQIGASVASAADGDFVVVWQSYGSAGTDADLNSIQGQRYSSEGMPRGAEFQINSYTTNQQTSPSVAAAPDRDFVVVWQSSGSSGTDTNNTSIQAQRYIGASSAVPAMSFGTRSALAAALLLGAAYALRRRA